MLILGLGLGLGLGPPSQGRLRLPQNGSGRRALGGCMLLVHILVGGISTFRHIGGLSLTLSLTLETLVRLVRPWVRLGTHKG